MSVKIFTHIGIDPDIEKCGVAIWDAEERRFELIESMPFWDVIDILETWDWPLHVALEAGWLIEKSNFHDRIGQNKFVGEKIALNVGRNHQIGHLLQEYCNLNDILCTLIKPQGKIDRHMFRNITGVRKTTNQDQRDAAMLVYDRNILVKKESI